MAPLFSVVVPASVPPLAVNSPPFTVVSVAVSPAFSVNELPFSSIRAFRLTTSDTECLSVAPGTTDSGTGIGQQYTAISHGYGGGGATVADIQRSAIIHAGISGCVSGQHIQASAIFQYDIISFTLHNKECPRRFMPVTVAAVLVTSAPPCLG